MRSKLDSQVASHARSMWQATVSLYGKIVATDFFQKVVETFITCVLFIGIRLGTISLLF